MVKRLAIATVLFLAFVGPSQAGFFEGLVAHERGDYETAVREFSEAAEQG